MYGVASTGGIEARSEPRDEVFHRVRAIANEGLPASLVLVNVSPNGFMARDDSGLAIGDRLRLTLPQVGIAHATVRWSLGGRIGCHFDTPVEFATYYAMLAALRQR